MSDTPARPDPDAPAGPDHPFPALPMPERPTAEVLRAAAGRDPVAWAELVRRYTPVVRARTAPFGLQQADRLDVAQTAWLRLAQHIDRIHTPEHLGGWLATTVTRECLQLRRAQARTVAGGEQVGVAVRDPAPGPEDATVAADVARRLWRAVAALPPARRELVRALFAQPGASYAEIARATGMPVGGIGPTRGRALRDLRRLLGAQADALR